MARKIRSDIKVGNLEKKLGLNKGAIRNPDGSDARSDKKLGTLRDEYERRYAGPPVRTSSTISSISSKASNTKKSSSKGKPSKPKPSKATRKKP